MKDKFLYAILIFGLFACSDDDITNAIDNGQDIAIDILIAEDDTYFATQNKELGISTMLDNDSIFEFARIASFDEETTEGGSVQSRGDNVYLYTPSSDFLGTDSFTYTICDNLDPQNCSTATVFVNVDEFTVEVNTNIIVRDDEISMEINTSIIIDNLFDNDFFSSDIEVEIASINEEFTEGTIVLNADNTIDYTPVANFIGMDTFEYTVCNVDESICEVGIVTISVAEIINFNITSDVSAYYEQVFFFDDAQLLLQSLQDLTVASHFNILEYTDRHDYLYDADAEINNSNNVVLMYSGEIRADDEWVSGLNSNTTQTYNTEHIYPQSFLPGENQSDPSTRDLHNLRVVDASTNSSRSNHPFVDGSGVFIRIDDTWYPGDEWKGDVARIVMYMNMYYDEPFQDVGNLDLFLEWNIEDPVSDFELQCNNVIEDAQGNRNPFIDNPYLATLIWGGDNAENTWE